MNENVKFNSTFEYKVIYVFRINDGKHSGCVKIGDATIHTSKPYTDFAPNCHELNYATKQRIDSYTSTAGVIYELLYTEIAVFTNDKGKLKAFRDHKVHDVLKRSGIEVKKFETNKIQNEWFKCDLETAKKAIQAVKEGKTALNSSQISNDKNPIIFRPEQKEAIKKTIARYKHDTKMLWNAKMRFGKTLTALEVAKQMGFKRTIIITHRPVVSDGWFEDFGKIFYDKPEYFFGSKTKGKTISDLLKHDNNFVYFASMQDLRGSDKVGGNFDKNDDIFKTDWDFVVVDEAHEGTKTELGKNVLQAVIKEDKNDTHKTYVLELSGTPFNLLTDFEQESIYTWDYIMEQEAKTTWDKYHFGDSNPYEELPRMNIFTYHLEKSLPVYIDVMDKAFNFREFFRLWTGDIKKDGKPIPKGVSKGDFVHEQDIKAFLDLICKKDETTNYPFSTNEYRNFFRHSLWVVPGVREAKALSALLKNHHIFKNFTIVNVAGDGDEEIDTTDALKAVKKAMTDNPDTTYTITLSCGRLTTGVSVPEWTAVLMLAGTYSTAASQYLQTIFRVQTPANINGKIKEECFVFDFAPDRTLKMVAESVQLSARAGSTNPVAEITLGKFLNFCPVIAIEDSNMKEYKVAELLQELKKAYAERVARNGFDDPKIYNDELLKLTEVELKEFEKLRKIVGDSKQTKKTGEIDINKEGFNEEETEEEKNLKKKTKKELTEEEKARLAELKEKRKNRDSAISILRAISIRMPLLVYGMDIDIAVDVTIDNFADLIDDVSWEEFMPKGVTKAMFKQFSKYYDKDIFVAASRRIRYIAKTADELEPTERVIKIAGLFATFKNPDKETVLTPWRVVNLHLSDTIGGYDFYDESHNALLDNPRCVEQGTITKNIFNDKSKILEINSKTGLYPLYMCYSLFREHIAHKQNLSFEEDQKIWDFIVENQIFVICKTPMAKQITKRTLLGYRKGKSNMHAFDDLIMQMTEKPDKLIEKIESNNFWNIGGNGKMRFNAVVGNPPYQVETAKQQSETNGQARRKSIFQYFQMAADGMNADYVSLIYPGARWIHRSGKGMSTFGLEQINDKKLVKLEFYPNSQDIFNGISIDDGISIVLKSKAKASKEFEYVYHENGLATSVCLKNPGEELIPLNPANASIVKKVTEFVEENNLKYIFDRVLSQKLFGVESSFIEDNPGKSKPYKKNIIIDYSKEVKLFTNDKAGPAGRSQWFVVDKDLIPTNRHYIDEWQVVVSSAHPGGQAGRDNQLEIIDNHSAFGRARVAIGSFKSQTEAENYYKYIQSNIIKFMFLMTDEALTSLGKKVPDLIDYSNENKLIDFAKNIDEQLLKLTKITDSEFTYIKSKLK
jgi:superfamily II DNA or RNA helicase